MGRSGWRAIAVAIGLLLAAACAREPTPEERTREQLRRTRSVWILQPGERLDLECSRRGTIEVVPRPTGYIERDLSSPFDRSYPLIAREAEKLGANLVVPDGGKPPARLRGIAYACPR